MTAVPKDLRRPNVLPLRIKDKVALHAAYMPFVKGGGLFVPTPRRYDLGDEVFVLLTLLDEKERIPIAGRVVWLTPGKKYGRLAGIGVQFSEKDSGIARTKIEAILGNALNSDRPTHTM
jgi:type IV pilus assembly protein PilZ